MTLPVTVTRIQNRRGTQAEFDALYPPGYGGSGGVDINEYPGILLPGELALCTDTRSVYIGNTNGEYVRIADDISNIELLPLSLLLFPVSVYVPIPELSFSATSFYNLDYSLFDSETINWNTPGVNLARNGVISITALMPLLNGEDVTLTETYTELNKYPSDKYISFKALYNQDNNGIEIYYKHNFPVPVRFNTSSKSWIPFVTSVPPVITSVMPSSGSSFGGTPITITGENLSDLISLTIGGKPALDVDVVDDNTITAITPSGTVGIATLEVVTLAGTDSEDIFSYYSTWPSVLESEISSSLSTESGFAKDTDISMDTMVVGLPESSVGTDTFAGSAVVYNRVSGSWVEITTLTPSISQAGAAFGSSVAIHNDLIVVGEPFNSVNGANSGSAHVYKRTNGNWAQIAQLYPSDPAIDSFFGHSVDVYNDTIVVGAKGRNSNTGAVYVYGLVDNLWTQQDILVANDASPNSNFGVCSIHKDTVAVGAETSGDTGAAYVFYRSSGIWGQQSKLIGSTVSINDQFGYSVDVYENTVVVGSPNDNPIGSGSGSAYVYFRQGATWEEQTKLIGSAVSFQDKFGTSVSIFENVVAVGAPYDDEVVQDTGSVYIFTREETQWTERERLQVEGLAETDLYGYSVSMDNTTLVVGAPNADSSIADVGKVFVYIPE